MNDGLNKHLEVWVVMNDGSLKIEGDTLRLRARFLYRKIEEVEGITWVLVVSYNVQ
jgi:hypothetical protein